MQKLNGEEIVLVVEDDTNDAFFIKRALQSAGITRPAHICQNGREGISYLCGEGDYADRTRFPYPHFVLTDLKMPVASGFELLEWLQNHPDFQVIPTIVFSSSADPKDVKRAYCLGANAYVCKPADPVEFKKTITDLIRFWESCERPMVATPGCEELTREAH